jgi:hypothetical protein
MSREAAPVELVDHRFDERPLQRPVTFPVVPARVHDDALHRDGVVRARPAGGGAIVTGGNGHGTAVRIEEKLLRSEPESFLGLPRTVRPVGIDLPRFESTDECVPVVIGAVRACIERNGARWCAGAVVVEQQQFDEGRVLRVHAEVDPVRTDGGAEWRTGTDLDRAHRDRSRARQVFNGCWRD